MTVPRFLLFTFSDAERVVSAGDKVIKCNEEVGVALGRPQQVLLGAPAHGLRQRCGVQTERPVESFWRKRRGNGERERERKVKPYDKCD